MSSIHSVTRCLVVSTTGASIWLLTGLIASDGRPEDVYVYVNGALPVLVAGSAWAGWLDPRRPWRWGVAMVSAIPILHWIASMGPVAPRVLHGMLEGYPADLFSLSLFMLACIVASSAGAWLRTSSPKPEEAEHRG